MVDPDIRLLKDEDGLGFRLGHGMEVRSVGLPDPVAREILEGLQLTRGDGAGVWTAVHRQLPQVRHKYFRPLGHERLVGMERRMWAANSPCPPVVVWPKKSGPSPNLETVVVLWGWVTVRGFGGHVFTALHGTVVKTDGRVALQLTAEPLTTHVLVLAL